MTEDLAILSFDRDLTPDELEHDDVSDAGIRLPGFEDVTDKKVMATLKSVFVGLDFDPCSDTSSFESVEALGSYVNSCIADIAHAKLERDKRQVLWNGAMMARFWHTAKTLDNAFKSQKYGENIRESLANAMERSVPWIYSVRNVAVELTLSECYLLGTRGCDTTSLRCLARIHDKSIRDGIIHAFVDAISNTADSKNTAKALRAFKDALNAKALTKTGEKLIESSDPETLGPEVMVNEGYDAALRNIRQLCKYLKPLTDNDRFVDYRDSMAGMYVTDATPNADVAVDKAKQQADTAITLIDKILDMLPDLKAELKSVSEGLSVQSCDELE